MGNQNHHLCIHGHFYQPPRENPWLGVIEEQPSAQPYHDWNDRITDECYRRLARTPLRDEDGRITDLYNCYAHMSFNIGPTLFEWLMQHHPELCRHIVAGERLGAGGRGGHGHALAQAYNHTILPLGNARDRHTQILWGLKEFAHRYGRPARGMWLAECAIDMNTIRALIDHKIKFVILSPHQASTVRPFGTDEWNDVYGGGIDPRHPYRVFEVDGAGRTHFDRSLDIIFYEPTLSTRISFEHLLQDPARFEEQLAAYLDENAELPQLVTIATDGEIYGHHEWRGEETLAILFAKLAPKRNLYVANTEQYLAENPPCWEVKLWMGEDGKGSSWSCRHGVGRWYRDCGCQTGGPDHWHQRWRMPLRNALDQLRDRIDTIVSQVGQIHLYDPWEARNDYIHVLLDPSPKARQRFLRRHQRHPLDEAAQVQVWRLLEATSAGMCMYTSCGWFFNDVAGIEPVQNLRYALRAIDLVQPHCDEDLSAMLARTLEDCPCNLEQFANAREVMEEYALPTRYDESTLAATFVLKHLLSLPRPECVHDAQILEKSRGERDGKRRSQGEVQLTDPRTQETHAWGFAGVADTIQNAGVLLWPIEDQRLLKQLLSLPEDEQLVLIRDKGIPVRAMPDRDRREIAEALLGNLTRTAMQNVKAVYDQSVPLLAALAQARLEAPPILRSNAEKVLSARFAERCRELLDREADPAVAEARVQAVLDEAQRLHASLDRDAGRDALHHGVRAWLKDFLEETTVDEVDRLCRLLTFADANGISLRHELDLQESAWLLAQNILPRLLHRIKPGEAEAVQAAIARLLEQLQFDPAVLTRSPRE